MHGPPVASHRGPKPERGRLLTAVPADGWVQQGGVERRGTARQAHQLLAAVKSEEMLLVLSVCCSFVDFFDTTGYIVVERVGLIGEWMHKMTH